MGVTQKMLLQQNTEGYEDLGDMSAKNASFVMAPQIPRKETVQVEEIV